MKGSKYIQSSKNQVYINVKKDLQNSRKTLFIGLPCEVGALKNFIKNHQEFLFTCELVCHGPTSRKVAWEYVNGLEKKYRSSVKSLNLRYKNGDWKIPYIKIEFANGKVFMDQFYHTEYGYAFYFMGMESCYNCRYKGDKSVADITIGDFWGLSKYDKDYNELGVSMGIVHTEKGKGLLQNLELFHLFTASYEDATRNNEDVYNSRQHKPREIIFRRYMEKYSLFQAYSKHNSLYMRLKSKGKRILENVKEMLLMTQKNIR